MAGDQDTPTEASFVPARGLDDEPGAVQRAVARVRESKRFQAAVKQAQRASDDARTKAEAAGRRIVKPLRLERFEDVSRASQWIAAFALPFFIIPNLVFVVAFKELLEDILLQTITDGQLVIMEFLVTALTLAAFIFSAWLWFQWVRTGGFGIVEV